MSLPVRERGLKLHNRPSVIRCHRVAPRSGAWIEIIVITATGAE